MSASSESTYLLLYTGRYRRLVRIVSLGVLTVGVAISHPAPSGHGDGLVILLSLIVAVATQASLIWVLPGRASIVRATLGAVSSGLLVGYDPGVATSILLAFAGLDAGANLEFAPGVIVTGAAVVAVLFGDLVLNNHGGYASLGTVAVAGYLLATTRKQYVLRAEEAELRLVDIERAREEHAIATNLAARANAAREIHDILAHSLGALVLQLDALDAVLTSEVPDRSRAAEVLARARALAVDGLTEARRAVGSLRDDAPPLIEALRQLVDTSGTAVLDITGSPRPTAGEVAVALRRTAQEGLTNAAKHAPGAPATVQLAFTPDQVVLTVIDTGRPPGVGPAALADTGGGYGLEGLRERAKLIGGTLTAGPLDDGWKVQLSVPDDQTAARQPETA
jgi:signal transduction histidine kinase